MAVIQVWRAANRRWRIELAEVRGRMLYRVLTSSACIAEVASVEQVEAVRAEHGVCMRT
jgi:hypothetical protein